MASVSFLAYLLSLFALFTLLFSALLCSPVSRWLRLARLCVPAIELSDKRIRPALAGWLAARPTD